MWCFSCLYFLWYRQRLLTLHDRWIFLCLPQSHRCQSEVREPVKVELTVDKQIFLNGEKGNLEEFESALFENFSK